MNYAEEDKVRLATYLLQDHAEQWSQSMAHTKYANHEGPIPWEEFLVAFQDKYFPEHIKDQKEREFSNLIQGSMSMLEFEQKFSSLGRYAPHIFDDPRRKLTKFVSGLRGNIRHFIVASDPETFAKAVRVACLMEEEHNKSLAEKKKLDKRPAP